MNQAEILIKSFKKKPWVYVHQDTLNKEASTQCLIEQPKRLPHKRKKSQLGYVSCQLFMFSDGSVISNFDYLSSIAVPPGVKLNNPEVQGRKYAAKAEYIDTAQAYASLEDFKQKQRLIFLTSSQIETIAAYSMEIYKLTGNKSKRTVAKTLTNLRNSSIGVLNNLSIFHPCELKLSLEMKLTKETWQTINKDELEVNLKHINDWLKSESFEFHLVYNHHSAFITAVTSAKVTC